jgi:starch synthase
MLKVLHISAECYPAAKTGGLGDVVGSLPKYMCQAGVSAGAIIPKYATKWIKNQSWTTVFGGSVRVDGWWPSFEIQQLSTDLLGFPLFVVDVPGLFDRSEIYGHDDEIERYLVFQQAVLKWIQSFSERPRVLHCHDHHSGLLAWMTQYCPEYQDLRSIPTVFTIHNGNYQGQFSWRNRHKLPYFEEAGRSVIDWGGAINPLAASVRCAWAVTTVSPSYLQELHEKSLGLEPLFNAEWRKQSGILNGIDADVWNPANDPMLENHLENGEIGRFKWENKQNLLKNFALDTRLPLVAYIGRMAAEKGADLLPDTIRKYLNSGGRVAFLILGSGDSTTENDFQQLKKEFPGLVDCYIGYHEGLSHQIYAGADFLIMPSRVEPCGLNQMYSMRYGTIPIVRSIGGLRDTVFDLDQADGRGICFDEFLVEAAANAIHRAAYIWYNQPNSVEYLRGRIMGIDFSWESAVGRYFDVYRKFGAI